MVISLLSIKGAVFIAKSASSKLLTILETKYGIERTGAAATVAGGIAVKASIPENAKTGFKKVVEGVCKGSYADFMDGLYHLGKSYSSANGLMDDLLSSIDAGHIDSEVKFNLKKSLNDLKPLIINEIENKSYELLKECEEYLKQRGMSGEDYISEIKNIYFRNTYNIEDNYRELLGQGGKIYDEISTLNQRLHIVSPNEFDHYLVYCMAGWMIDNLQLSCIRNVSQKQLAGDITDNIFAYLRYMNK